MLTISDYIAINFDYKLLVAIAIKCIFNNNFSSYWV